MPDSGQSPSRRVLRLAVPLFLILVALFLGAETRRLERQVESPYPMGRAAAWDEGLIELPVWIASTGGTMALDLPLEFAFRRGETLGQVLSGLGLESADAQQVVSELSDHVDVRRLRPEDRYAALVDREGRLQGVRLILAGKGTAEARKQGGEWSSSWLEFVETSITKVIQGSLEGSLEASIVAADGETPVAYVMADVLQWDLDFNRDLRLGDRFSVLYETVYLDGEFHRVGALLALRYENRGRTLTAFRFGEDRGYYDREGRPLRKLFLRSPLRYSRITSGFSNSRFHPVLKRYRPHYGVDYGAPVGTPVRVTGNGVVQSAGWDKGGGKTVKVRHPNGYSTAYLHLSRFATGIRAGTRVIQGEVIGYVGSTGLASGPHLDYRMQKNGRWINPQAFKSEPAEPIPPDRLAQFEAVRDRFDRALAEGQLPAEDLDRRIGHIASLESP